MGKQRMAVEIARQLLEIMEDGVIAAKTGLSEAEVAGLRSEKEA